MSCLWNVYSHYRTQLLAVIITVLFSPILVLIPGSEARCSYLILVMSFYWILHVFPLPITSLLPVVLAPLLGIRSSHLVVTSYFKEVVMIFIGSMIINLSIENTGLHKRLLIGLITFLGTTPNLLLLAVMVATWFLALLMTGTAAAALIIPLAVSMISELEQYDDLDIAEETSTDVLLSQTMKIKRKKKSITREESYDHDNVYSNETSCSDSYSGACLNESPYQREQRRELSKDTQFYDVLLLSIAYSANVGGIMTSIATPANIILWNTVHRAHKSLGIESNAYFINWVAYSIVISAIIFIVLYMWMVLYSSSLRSVMIFSLRNKQEIKLEKKINSYIESQNRKLGSISFGEMTMSIVFVVMIYLVLGRKTLAPFGWQSFFNPGTTSDSLPIMFIVFVLFLIPSASSSSNGQIKTLMDWSILQRRFPWGVILVIGGAYSIADLCNVSGLSRMIGENILQAIKGSSGQAVAHYYLSEYRVAIMTAVTSVLSETATNTAVSSIMIPISACMSLEFFRSPLYLMLPITVISSMSFILPVSSPPNAIVFSTGRFTAAKMLYSGLVPSLISILTVILTSNLFAESLFTAVSGPLYVNTTSFEVRAQACWILINQTHLD